VLFPESLEIDSDIIFRKLLLIHILFQYESACSIVFCEAVLASDLRVPFCYSDMEKCQ